MKLSAINPPTVAADHATLIDMTVPLMGGSWQRDRIYLGTAMPPALATGIVRSGKVAIDLALAAAPSIALAAPQRVTLAYDPGNLPDARAALIAG
ncbi:MAG: hypothetical protein HC870_02955, partial [Rhizobiales bacterium]|nr:hypothetical protein [Hyphomicrobiales bacterium]